MGTGIEDVVAVKALETGCVPPVANFKEVDPELGPLNLSRGGAYPVEFALRLGAGFGSQIDMTLMRRVAGGQARPRPNALGYSYRIADASALPPGPMLGDEVRTDLDGRVTVETLRGRTSENHPRGGAGSPPFGEQPRAPAPGLLPAPHRLAAPGQPRHFRASGCFTPGSFWLLACANVQPSRCRDGVSFSLNSEAELYSARKCLR
jgi:hypothetical protein